MLDNDLAHSYHCHHLLICSYSLLVAVIVTTFICPLFVCTCCARYVCTISKSARCLLPHPLCPLLHVYATFVVSTTSALPLQCVYTHSRVSTLISCIYEPIVFAFLCSLSLHLYTQTIHISTPVIRVCLHHHPHSWFQWEPVTTIGCSPLSFHCTHVPQLHLIHSKPSIL